MPAAFWESSDSTNLLDALNALRSQALDLADNGHLTVSIGSILLSIVSDHGAHLTPANFHIVFFAMALLSLLALPSYLSLKPEDGAFVRGYKPHGLPPAPASESAE